MKLEFSQQIFEKNIVISNFMKFRPLKPLTNGQTERQTVITKLKVAFRNFGNTPKNELIPRFGGKIPPSPVLRQQ
jgi:hypothetical protein